MEKQIETYLDDLKDILADFPVVTLKKVVESILAAYETEKKILLIGNGGSAATASHFACDLNKGVGYKLNKRFRAYCLTDNIPTMLAYGNDVSFDDIFVEQVRGVVEEGDVLIAISASGHSKNILKAVELAKTSGAVTIGLTGGSGGELADLCKYTLLVKSQDMQKIEDLHLITTHIIMQVLLAVLSGRRNPGGQVK